MTDYGEIFCGAVNQIVQAELSKQAKDITITCTIIDAEKALDGEYIVSTGSGGFVVYSEVTTYSKNDTVYVTVPNGNMNEQKFIIGRKRYSSTDNVVLKDDYKSFVSIMDYSIPNKHSLDFNSNTSTDLFESKDASVHLSEVLRVEGTFFSNLEPYKPTSGTYGLKIVLGTIENNSYEYKFSSDEMLGLPYSFLGGFKQRKYVDVSGITDKITSVKVSFYQENFIFENNPPTQGDNVATIDAKDIKLSFGFLTENIGTGKIFIFGDDIKRELTKTELKIHSDIYLYLNNIYQKLNYIYQDSENTLRYYGYYAVKVNEGKDLVKNEADQIIQEFPRNTQYYLLKDKIMVSAEKEQYDSNTIYYKRTNEINNLYWKNVGENTVLSFEGNLMEYSTTIKNPDANKDYSYQLFFDYGGRNLTSNILRVIYLNPEEPQQPEQEPIEPPGGTEPPSGENEEVVSDQGTEEEPDEEEIKEEDDNNEQIISPDNQ